MAYVVDDREALPGPGLTKTNMASDRLGMQPALSRVEHPGGARMLVGNACIAFRLLKQAPPTRGRSPCLRVVPHDAVRVGRRLVRAAAIPSLTPRAHALSVVNRVQAAATTSLAAVP